LYGIPETKAQTLVYGVQQAVSVENTSGRENVFAAGVLVFDFIVEKEMQVSGSFM
jgi:hypothetical protein